MKSLFKVLCLAAASAAPLFAQTVDPCAQTAKLSGGTNLQMNGNQGTGNLSGTSYHYEIWVDQGGASGAKLTWYGANQGGGAAFKAEWTNPDDYLGRIGYYWGNGSTYPTYKNIYVDYNYTRSGAGGDYSYIGIYGWSRNNSASNANERLIEYYVVDDWFGNQWQNDGSAITTNTTGGSSIGSFTMDGETYNIVKNTRVNKPSIDGDKTFTQIFSIRQKTRKCGTISLTEHYKKWENLGLTLGNLYEAKFLAEAGGGTGSLDLSYLKLSQEDTPRGSTGGGGTSSSSGGTTTSSSSSVGAPVSCNYQTSFCGGMSFANVSNATSIPSAGACVYIGDFDVIQPNLSSTIAINGLENTCGAEWDDCSYNDKPSAIDGGYYVYVKTGTVNSYENNGWQGIVAKAKPNCTSFTQISSSSSAVTQSSSSAQTTVSSSSSEAVSPIITTSHSPLATSQSLYYNLKGIPMGANKPTKPGVYIEKHGSIVQKIVVR